MNLVSKFTSVVSREKFDDIQTMSTGGIIMVIINLIIAMLIICWIGQWLFNSVLIKVVPSIHKIAFVEFLGLYILTHILFC